jgi:beta-lactamase class A
MKKYLPITLVIIVALVIIGSIGFLAWRFFQGRTTQPPQKIATKQDLTKQRAQKQEVLIETAKELFASESSGTSFSLAIYDLKNGDYFGYNDEKAQHAASVSKVLTAVYVFDQIEKGKASLADPMGAYNIEFQLEKMINISNSESWEFIDERFKPKNQNKFAKSIDLTATDIRVGKNLMSPKDVAILLKKVAKEEILSDDSRLKLFSYMQKTESEDYFSPAFKLEGVTFYHKTGKYEGEGHDAAIVEHDSNPFVLVVFTNNNTNTDLISRGTIMTKVASLVYDYFDELD